MCGGIAKNELNQVYYVTGAYGNIPGLAHFACLAFPSDDCALHSDAHASKPSTSNSAATYKRFDPAIPASLFVWRHRPECTRRCCWHTCRIRVARFGTRSLGSFQTATSPSSAPSPDLQTFLPAKPLLHSTSRPHSCMHPLIPSSYI